MRRPAFGAKDSNFIKDGRPVESLASINLGIGFFEKRHQLTGGEIAVTLLAERFQPRMDDLIGRGECARFDLLLYKVRQFVGNINCHGISE